MMFRKKLMNPKNMGIAAGIVSLGAAAAMFMRKSRRM
jgi:hypothetical protein